MPAFSGDEMARFPSDLASIIHDLHQTPHRTVFHFAGAGAWTLALVHSVPGSSRTVLEATDLYHPASLQEALTQAGLRSPEKAVSLEIASGLAAAAHTRAQHLVRKDENPGPTVGIGLTATLATDRPKRGEHHFALATRDALGTHQVEVHLKKGFRTRAGEEEVVAQWFSYLAGRVFGILRHTAPKHAEGEEVNETFHEGDAFGAFLLRSTEVLMLDARGEVVPEAHAQAQRPIAIVSGSFHPMHEGHRQLAAAAQAHLGGAVAYEMAPLNAEKAPTAPLGIRNRVAQAYGDRPMLLTHEPLFTDKATALPGTVFVVGVDTARRVLEPRFYGGEAGQAEAFQRIRSNGCRFLVAGRAGEDAFRTLADLDLPEELNDLFEALPGFRIDVSSTEVRQTWGHITGETSNSNVK